MTLNEFFKTNEMISARKLKNSDSDYKFSALSKNVKLNGVCNENRISAKIVAANGNTLYSMSENVETGNICNKIEEIVDIYNQTVDILEDTEIADLDRTKDDVSTKQILLDNNDTDVASTEEATNIGEFSMSIFIDKLSELAEEVNAYITDNFKDVNKLAIATGLVSSLYTVISDFQFFEDTLDNNIESVEDFEDVSETLATESLAVAPKIDYMDLSVSGIGQACYGLGKCEGNYEELIGKLKDIKSELLTNN